MDVSHEKKRTRTDSPSGNEDNSNGNDHGSPAPPSPPQRGSGGAGAGCQAPEIGTTTTLSKRQQKKIKKRQGAKTTRSEPSPAKPSMATTRPPQPMVWHVASTLEPQYLEDNVETLQLPHSPVPHSTNGEPDPFEEMGIAGVEDLVSVIIPCHDDEQFLDECLLAAFRQRHRPLEVVISDDASKDSSPAIMHRWLDTIKRQAEGSRDLPPNHPDAAHAPNTSEYLDVNFHNVQMKVRHTICHECQQTATANERDDGQDGHNHEEQREEKKNKSTTESTTAEDSTESNAVTAENGTSVTQHEISLKKCCSHVVAEGAGRARNVAISHTRGRYICVQDSDDIMLEERVQEQLAECKLYPNAIVGARFRRIPEGSTAFYTNWANSLSNERLFLEQYREVTLIQPTWFFRRALFARIGGYIEVLPDIQEDGHTPEDMVFFHQHLDLHRDTTHNLRRIAKPLVLYRMHGNNISFKIKRRTLLKYKSQAFERRVLAHWDSFMIWGGGRDGRQFLRALSIESQRKCSAFCDIDPKKIGTTYALSKELKIPVIHFSEARPPLVMCVAMGRTGGEFERNIETLNIREGVDYWHVI